MDATNTLMTEPAATTTEGQTTSTATTDAATTTNDVANQQQATDGKTENTTTDAGADQKPDGDQDAADDKPTGAPEKYEFKIPEGVQMDEAGLKSFSEFAKEFDMSQEAAQAMLEKMGPAWQQRQMDAIKTVHDNWATESRADKEFGGEKLSENLAVAEKALQTFGTPELRTLLKESGLGNHPEIIRAFYRAGKSISEESKFVGNSQGNPKAGSRDHASHLYPNQPH